MKPFARINLSSAALRSGCGNGMCNYPVSNIQYPLFNDGGANWILAAGCWIFAHFHIQHDRGVEVAREGDDGQPRHDVPRLTQTQGRVK